MKLEKSLILTNTWKKNSIGSLKLKASARNLLRRSLPICRMFQVFKNKDNFPLLPAFLSHIFNPGRLFAENPRFRDQVLNPSEKSFAWTLLSWKITILVSGISPENYKKKAKPGKSLPRRSCENWCASSSACSKILLISTVNQLFAFDFRDDIFSALDLS